MTYDTLQFDGYTLDFSRQALIDESRESVPLRPKTFAVLVYLVNNRELAVSKREILDAVWAGVVVEDQAVFQAISELRAAFRRSDYIRTVHGHGYQWVAVTQLARPRAEPMRPSRHAFVRLAAVFLFGAVLMALLPHVSERVSPRQQVAVDRLLQRARQHLANDEIEAAETYLSFIVEQFPGHLRSRIELAYLYDQVGRSFDAQTLAHAVYDASSETDEIVERILSANLIGNRLLSEGDYASAERYGMEALQLAARANDQTLSAAAHELLGETSVAAGRLVAAGTQFGAALELYAGVCPASEERVEQRLIDLAQTPPTGRPDDELAI